MWSNPSAQEPIEKIRKAQWTAENTAETQKVVTVLRSTADALEMLGLRASPARAAIVSAVMRFKQLDPKIEILS